MQQKIEILTNSPQTVPLNHSDIFTDKLITPQGGIWIEIIRRDPIIKQSFAKLYKFKSEHSKKLSKSYSNIMLTPELTAQQLYNSLLRKYTSQVFGKKLSTALINDDMQITEGDSAKNELLQIKALFEMTDKALFNIYSVLKREHQLKEDIADYKSKHQESIQKLNELQEEKNRLPKDSLQLFEIQKNQNILNEKLTDSKNARIQNQIKLYRILLINDSTNNKIRKPHIPNPGSLPDLKPESSEDIYVTDYLIHYHEKSQSLFQFYKLFENRLIWFHDNELTDNGKELLKALENSWKEGLNEEEYNTYFIKALLKDNSENGFVLPSQLISADMLLSVAYLSYAKHLANGSINPKDLNIVWEGEMKTPGLCKKLAGGVKSNTVAETLKNLNPENHQYQLLKNALSEFHKKNILKEWNPPKNLATLRKGDSIRQVLQLKKHLHQTGDLAGADSLYLNSLKFDSTLEAAVKRFQRRNGLVTDGLVGKETLITMNVPPEYRIKQIELNLNRLRWMQENTPERKIVINLPDFTMKYFENGEVADQMNVIIGKLKNYTPLLKDTITYLVFNPSWNVPRSIASEEMLPRIKNDTTYLERNNFTLLRGSYLSTDTARYDSINWDRITKDNFPFYIVQEPGNSNALGRVKFIMNNHLSIYLHDTPADYLFKENDRNFSHGCIRLERPLDLAANVLKGQVSEDQLMKILSKKETRKVFLDDPIPVQIVYHTTWVNEWGQIQFRKDVYEFDEIYIRLLEHGNKSINADLQ